VNVSQPLTTSRGSLKAAHAGQHSNDFNSTGSGLSKRETSSRRFSPPATPTAPGVEGVVYSIDHHNPLRDSINSLRSQGMFEDLVFLYESNN
jgi:hypothetical protein